MVRHIADPAGAETDVVQFTYADPTFSKPKQALIRAIEKVTGQPRLKRLYLENQRNPVAGESFFAAAVRQLRLPRPRFPRTSLPGRPSGGREPGGRAGRLPRAGAARPIRA